MRFITDLSTSEKLILEQLVKESSFYRERNRAQAILLSSQGHTIAELTRIFNVDRETITRWFNRFEAHRTFGLKDAPGRGRPAKVKQEEKKKSLAS